MTQRPFLPYLERERGRPYGSSCWPWAGITWWQGLAIRAHTGFPRPSRRPRGQQSHRERGEGEPFVAGRLSAGVRGGRGAIREEGEPEPPRLLGQALCLFGESRGGEPGSKPDPLRGAVLSAACRDLTSRQHDGLFAMRVFGQESAWNLFKSVAGNLLMGVREGPPGALPVPQTQKPTSHPKIGA